MSETSPTAERVQPATAFAKPHVFVLAAIDGPDLEAVYRIGSSETVVGRDPGADMALHDDEVSKNHCTIRYDAGRCHVIDSGSLNGTTVNDRPLRSGVVHRLRHLDEIQVGGTRLLFLAGRFVDQPRVDR